MKAAYVENGVVHVGEMSDPVPAKGQALVRTHSCGLCASDQHFLKGGRNWFVLRTRDSSVVLRVDDDDLKRVTSAVEERTGVKVARVVERKD